MALLAHRDRRPAAKEEIESLGGKFVGFILEGAATKGGYARPPTAEEQAEQAKMVAEHLKGQDIVVTTAQIPAARRRGSSPPRCSRRSRARSCWDMGAAESGGNVEGSRPGQGGRRGRGSRWSARNLPSRIAPATVLYARNLFNFVQLLVDPEEQGAQADTADDLIKGTLLTQGGAIVHDAFKQQRGLREQLHAAIDPGIFDLIIFVLAVFVGYYVVWSVTLALHTP